MAMLERLRGLFDRGGPKLAVRGAMLTDVGSVRDGNEDSVAFVLGEEADLAIVADGMGGHAAGEEASRIAVETIVRVFFEETGAVPRRLGRALADANAAILARAAAAPDLAGMGTTCTSLAFAGGEVFLGHVGDSRAYRIRGGAIVQMSRDHSLVAELVERGQLLASEAADSPDKNVILRALGIGETVEPQLFARGERISAGDVYVLCSDGLSDLVPLETIGEVAGRLEPAEACEALVAAALAAGGHDNVSVGVFRASEAGAGEAVPAEAPGRTREVAVPPP